MLPVLDLIVLILTFVFFGFIGFYFRPKRGDDTVEYFLARRQMAVIPAAFSISVTFFSSSGLTIFVGEAAMFGCPAYSGLLAALISGMVAVCFVQHRFYDSEYLSVFQFLEHRFSRSVRLINSLIFLVTGIVDLAVVGYTMAISAEVLAGIPFWVSAVTAGILTTTYSTLGGLRAIIWTDLCQAVLMVLFLVLICVKGLISLESLSQFTTVISDSQRAQIRFSESPSSRYSVQSYIINFALFFLHMQCVSQPGVQRWRSVKSLAHARWTVIASLLFSILFSNLIFATGLILYAFYAQCETVEGPFPTSDKLSLYFVMKELSSWPGVQGLCLAGIASGALSTMSSFMNSLAVVTMEDFVKIKFKSLSGNIELTVGKALTAAYGIVSTGLIFAASRSPAMAIVQITARSISIAPSLATFFLGLWTRRANALGVIIGMGISVLLVAWLSIGSALHGNRHVPLPSPQCPDNATSIVEIVERGILARIPPENNQTQRGFLESVYGVSFLWYPSISFVASIIVSYLFSIILSSLRKDSNHSGDDTVTCENYRNPSRSGAISVGLLERVSQNCKVLDEEHDMEEMCALRSRSQTT